MNTTEIGQRAEAKAAAYLEQHGFRVLDRNWRTRYCEIDIVAIKGSIIYFVEVKYRSRAQQGSGFEYITSMKLRQMRFAAEFWVSINNWLESYELAVVEVTADELELIVI